MKKIALSLLPLVLALTGCSSDSKKSVAAPPPPSVEDFFRNAEKTGFQISPDGKWISYLAPWENRMNLFIEPRDHSAPAQRLTDIKDRDLAGYFWKGNGRLIFERDFNGDENFQIFVVDIATKKVLSLTPFPKVRADIVDDLDMVDDNAILAGLNKRKAEVFDVYRLNLVTGKMKLVAENPGNIDSWITDHKGRLRAAVATDGVNHTILVRDRENQKFHPLLTTSFKY
jgi:hypothetical protein